MKISCPHCRQNYEVDGSYAGQNVQCQNCGNEFSVNASPVVMLPTKKCPMCGEEILAVAQKCKHCGEYLNSDGTSAEKNNKFYSASSLNSNNAPVDFFLYLLLALLFGGLGIHNFYDGKVTPGIVKIIITFGSVIFINIIPPIGIVLIIINITWIISELSTFNMGKTQ